MQPAGLPSIVHFSKQREKLAFVVFRVREQQGMNHFDLRAASK